MAEWKVISGVFGRTKRSMIVCSECGTEFDVAKGMPMSFCMRCGRKMERVIQKNGEVLWL